MSAVDDECCGIALSCDAQGVVHEVLRHTLPGIREPAAGETLLDWVDSESRGKAQDFVGTLAKNQAAFNWSLNVPETSGHIAQLHFAGGATPQVLVVIGARSRAEVARVYEDLMRINNEQTNALRSALKDLSLRTRQQSTRDADLMDELSRLNNELATAQRELARKNVELERLNEQKNRFLGIASHDLRNPLDVIASYSQFLLEEGVLDGQQREFVQRIRRSSRFMLKLVEDLLDIARIEAGKLELALEDTDLADLVSRNVTLNRVIARKKEIGIDLDIAADVPRVHADGAKIEQVLNNIIGNATKFSPPGSTVTVRVSQDGDGVAIAVADQGPGVPQDEMDKLFQPFEKTAVRSTAGEKGAGLGLAIVKSIVVGHGGRISVSVAPGEGSTFRVRLPRSGTPATRGPR